MTAAVALALAAAMPVAYAQTSTAPRERAPAAHEQMATKHIQPGQIRFTDINGATVYDRENRNIGDVKDVILGHDGRVAAVVLDVGEFLGIGGKLVAVGMHDLKIAEDRNNKPHISVAMTKEQLKAAQTYELSPRNRATGTSTPPPARNR